MITEKDDIIVFNTSEASKIKKDENEIQIYNLVSEDNPILREVMPTFDFTKPPIDPKQLASTLVETCRKNSGYGLSANQCGLKYRVFVMGAGDEYVAFFNPKVLKTYDECHMEEGCLSFPLLGLKITRAKRIDVEYQDYHGQTRQMTLDGISARCFLHELDHMNGIVYTDRAKPMALASGQKKRQKLIRNILQHGNKVKEAHTYR